MRPADAFLKQVEQAQQALLPLTYVFAGDTARCLHMLRALPVDQWKRLCHPWPESIEVLLEGVPPAFVRLSSDLIAREFAPAMLRSKLLIESSLFEHPVALPEPAFVLAQLLVDPDPLTVTQVADLLRCLPRDFDLESVRVLLKAVGKGEKYETLQAVAYVL